MNTAHIDMLNQFDLTSIPDLDEAVLGALELFQTVTVPAINLSMYHHPLVVGSGNAEATGRIIFQDVTAIFASESDFEAKLRSMPSIDGVVVVSASGGKHAPIIAAKAKKYGKHVTLITNTPNSPASQELDHQHEHDEYVFPKNREPYTYNTSTYMGMILGYTGENPANILRFIQQDVANLTLPDLSKFEKFFLIVPPEFTGIIRMIEVKFIELFGRKIARDVESAEYVKHATTVVPSEELFISFGQENTTWGQPANRVFIPLPTDAHYGAMMAIGYYIIGQIQKAHPPYFKQHLVEYTKQVSTIFNQTITPIVE